MFLSVSTQNEPACYNITRVVAIDGDTGSGGEVTYSLDEDDMLFYIDPSNGDLCANFSADRETLAEYKVCTVWRGRGGTSILLSGGGRR